MKLMLILALSLTSAFAYEPTASEALERLLNLRTYSGLNGCRVSFTQTARGILVTASAANGTAKHEIINGTAYQLRGARFLHSTYDMEGNEISSFITNYSNGEFARFFQVADGSATVQCEAKVL